ncbi:MAG TPA: peptidoglycan DD-metalloendopeptidase family protein [Acidimicrobiales bacterium]|nr:peptidoglycan DD-metalloendopeptidase family protein [Acidimicrobiales bacterium]
MRRPVPLALVALVLLSVPWSARAAEGDRSNDVVAAQKRANAAAARLAGAQTALARAEAEVAELERRTSDARARVDVLAGRLRDLAVARYVKSGVASPAVADDPGSLARGEAMLRAVTLGDTDDLDAYRVARDDLSAGQAALRKQLDAKKAVVSRLKAEQGKAMRELDELAAAQRAYEAKKAAEAREAAARSRQAAAARSRTTSAASPAGEGRVIATWSWICPVQGPHSFSNDWHQPRSGGRLHQGNDILAPRGTPVVASVSGTVLPHRSSLGGLSYYLSGDDGNVYFGTHLQTVTGTSGHVAAGTVIGSVGNTGNASGGPTHLHFEIHPGGGAPVNPYPTLVKYC